ncbi:IS607 family transposase, partial [Lactobacillus gallinarum]|nr:IS607 family transposase [Lactobacillus gallinarum]
MLLVITADEYISDIGLGLNYKHPKWLRLIKDIDANQIKEIYVTYEDRFIRFGFKFFQEFC